MQFNTYQSQEDFVGTIVESVEVFLSEKLKKQPLVRVAVSGGSSPRPVYEALAKSTVIDWGRVELFMVDERYVPLTNECSNYAMIQEVLASKVQLAHFYYFDTNEELDDALEDYADDLPDRFDLVLLGVGDDGHTASLFPYSRALETDQPVAHTEAPDHPIHDRLTLTIPTLMSSDRILFIVRGHSKQAVVDHLQAEDASVHDMPAMAFAKHSDVHGYYLPST